MARREQKFQVNSSGAFYVDRTCIDCLRCQKLAPEHFERDLAGHSFVRVQPETPEAIAECHNAVASCPVGAIGHDGNLAGPPPLKLLLPGLYACGHPSELSDNADAYLIVRPDGNVLVDVPAFHPSLVTQLEGLGDLRYIFLTHEDTVGEVEDFQLHFGAEVIMHASEADQVYLGVAQPFSTSGPLFPDLSVIHTPGHTRGSSCLLWRRHGGCLFVGDHLLPAGEELVPVKFDWTANWEQQLESAHGLVSEPWHHAFPAHGASDLPRGYMPKARAKLESWLERGAPLSQ
jgi:glyoxylase-like metal-dependent hydrolase (beta-lactamase superfamily II)/ferredoxin